MAWNSGSPSDTGNVSRLGAVNKATATNRDLFLKQFAGEVLTSFEEKNIAMPLHRVRTIKNGKSAQFPSVGTATAAYQKAGETILGDSINHSEVTVHVDDLLVSAAFIPRIDEAMNHYDVRSIYSKEIGNALANTADKNIFNVIYKAATGASAGDQEGAWAAGDAAWHSPTSSTEAAGQVSIGTTGADIVSGIINALEIFDGNDVSGEKVCVLTPASYYALMGTDTVAINRDTGGNGSTALGQVPTVGGVKILMSNHLPTSATGSTPLTAAQGGSDRDDYYDSDDDKLGGLIFTKDAAATVKLLDLGVESEYQIERQGTLMVAKYAMGHNVLRNKGAIALTITADA